MADRRREHAFAISTVTTRISQEDFPNWRSALYCRLGRCGVGNAKRPAEDSLALTTKRRTARRARSFVSPCLFVARSVANSKRSGFGSAPGYRSDFGPAPCGFAKRAWQSSLHV